MHDKLRKLVVRGQRGDTIVEVMIVLAVLGMAIGISYATANRSLQNTRQAQENSQASELLNSQIEQLRVSTDTSLYTSSTPFCMIGGALTPVSSTHLCQFNQTGSVCTSADPFCYTISITRASLDTFTATAQWDDISGTGTDTVTLDYRMPQLPAGATAWTDGSAPPSPGGGATPPGPQEVLTLPPAARSTTYGVLCESPDNRNSRVYYYSLTDETCAGNGTFDYDSTGDLTRYNIPCQFPDGRYAYTQATASLYCPAGSSLIQ